MATQNLPQTAPDGQPPLLPLPDLAHLKQQHKNKIITDWLNAVDDAQEALRNWAACLRAWQTHPHVVDEAFMMAVQNMSEAGLDEWLNASWADIDALRKVVTDES
jgi:hypothetical protein